MAKKSEKLPAALKKAAAVKSKAVKEFPLPKAPMGDAEKRKQLDEKIASMFSEGKVVFVVAKSAGTYPNCKRRKSGDKFKLLAPGDFSHYWMELVE